MNTESRREPRNIRKDALKVKYRFQSRFLPSPARTAALAAIAGAASAVRTIGDILYNFHWVVPGEAARAMQPWAGGLRGFLEPQRHPGHDQPARPQ